MGKQSRQKRRAGRPAPAPRHQPSPDPRSAPAAESSPEELVTALMFVAQRAFQAGDGRAFETAVEGLVERPDVDGFRAMVERVLTAKTGKPMLEAQMAKRRPGYADYVARTSGFIPLPPRRRSK